MSSTVTVKSYHGIGWDIRPGAHYARKKPDAIKLARKIALRLKAKRILVYRDDGTLQRTLILKEQTHEHY